MSKMVKGGGIDGWRSGVEVRGADHSSGGEDENEHKVIITTKIEKKGGRE